MSSDPSLVPTDRSPDRASFTLLSDGTQLAQDLQIQSITIVRELNRIAYAQIKLMDGDVATNDFPASAQDAFIPGKEFEIKVGYHGEEETLYKGLLIRHGLHARRDKPSVLTLECRDPAIKLAQGRKTAFFYEMSDSDIAAEIVEAHGLTAEVESSSVVHPEMVQYRVSDWDFLVSRMEHNGQLVSTEDGTIKAAPPDLSAEPALALVYGSTIIDFDAAVDSRDQPAGILAQSWDYAQQAPVEAEAAPPSGSVGGNLDAEELAAVTETEPRAYRHGGTHTEDELQAWADARLLRDRLAKVRGRVSCQGFDIRPGQMLGLSGVGDRFNGNFPVAAVRHEIIRSDWTTYIQFGIDPKWQHQKFSIEEPAPCMTAGTRGLHIGVTRQLGEDPNGEFRVLVNLPILDPEEEGIWARIATLDAGDSRGTFFRPEIDDEVIVGFLGGDLRDPVILGMLHSSAKVSPHEPNDDNHIKGYVSRSDMRLTFDDDGTTLTASTPGGNTVKLDETEGGIYIEDQNGNKVTLDGDGITMETPGDFKLTASGDVTIEGTNVNIAASAGFKAEGGSGAEVSTGAVAVLKGSLVQIN